MQTARHAATTQPHLAELLLELLNLGQKVCARLVANLGGLNLAHLELQRGWR